MGPAPSPVELGAQMTGRDLDMSNTSLFYSQIVTEQRSEDLDAVFGALADPTRRAILARLRDGEATVAELAQPFAISQPAVSWHLKVLESAGLIFRTRRATAHLSHLQAQPLRGVTTWLADYREFWQQSHDRLDELLATLQAQPSAQLSTQPSEPQSGRHPPERTS